MYHALNTEGTKVQVHRDFSGQTQLRCLVSTIAFGMVREVARSLAAYNNITILQGMDIPNVDLVIVHGVPKNMNEMYQVHVIKRINYKITCALSYSYQDEQVKVVVCQELICFMVNRK